MTDTFESRTARRLYKAAEKLSSLQGSLSRAECELRDAEFDAALSFWQRAKVSTVIFCISAPAATSLIQVIIAVRSQMNVGGFVILAVTAGLFALGSLATFFGHIESHRGGAAELVGPCRMAVNRAKYEVENAKREITTVRQCRMADPMLTPRERSQMHLSRRRRDCSP
jgi:hypothetical protein